ncbi:TolC family protein [Fusobacterium necrophorum]|uniref:TolC family protein n=1 Tax=Fusobacterium necrophorum TaxID=859 RepID=UPI00254B54FA|nr:TolC family protein [Fusobacterium necrophorum]MDK4482710.1 TolC family protein [Fusobacterium necrophorum]MDK4499826.1 TolC family protein [Fusobacterium necrophorum]MDK4507751.1 TolC family protein [Fusobacterium necrophorum]MDK4513928.1 TolC family protein [Fusobacterium necrophorum]MDK4519610.1 TolC family protein [Fusobacterium necrophorum]
MKKIAAIFFLTGTVLFAGEITLEEAIARALKHSREVQIAEKKFLSSKIKAKQAIKKALPSLVYLGNYQQSEYERMQAKNRTEKQGEKIGYRQSVTLTQPLFQGGSIVAEIQGAKYYESLFEIEYLQKKIETRLKTIQIYSHIIRAKKELEALRYSKKQLEQRYEKQKVQLELQLITRTDLLKTEYHLLSVESQMEKAKNEIEVQTENLKIQMGLFKDEKIEIQEFFVPKQCSAKIDFDKDRKQAMETSMSVLSAKYRLEIAKAEQRGRAGEMLPEINLFASYENVGERRTFNQSRKDMEWIGGVEVRWKLFSFGREYDSYKVATLEKETQELSQEKIQDSLRLKLREAYLDLCRLEILRDSKTKALETAELNFQMEQEKYDAGLISVVDYLDSEKQLREAKVSYYQQNWSIIMHLNIINHC